MAFDLLQTLGLKKKRPDLGPIMKAPLPPKSLTEFPIGADVSKFLRGRIAEGFGPDFVSRTTSPLTAELRAGFEERTLPGIESALSARGLGRSTIAARDIGRATQQNVRDINQVIAQAVLASEQERGRAAEAGRAFAGTEAGLATGVAGEQTRRAGIEFGTEQAQQLAGQQTINQLISGAFGLGSAALGGGTTIDRIRQLEEAIRVGQRRGFTAPIIET